MREAPGMTWNDWLRAQQDRDDQVGDLARDAAIDDCNRSRSPQGLRRHVNAAHHGDDTCGPALDLAAEEWAT